MPRRRVIPPLFLLPLLLPLRPWSGRPRRRRRDERGAALVEYALVLGLVVIACIAVLVVIGGYVAQHLSDAGRGFHP